MLVLLLVNVQSLVSSGVEVDVSPLTFALHSGGTTQIQLQLRPRQSGQLFFSGSLLSVCVSLCLSLCVYVSVCVCVCVCVCVLLQVGPCGEVRAYIISLWGVRDLSPTCGDPHKE